MLAEETDRACAAALGLVREHGLVADEALVLSDSNKVILRVLPADLVARVARHGEHVAPLELAAARALAASGSPIVRLDPRVEARAHERDGFVMTLWEHAAPGGRPLDPADYAAALARLHHGMRGLRVDAPHFLDRVAAARAIVTDPARSPDLAPRDRALLDGVLAQLGAEVHASGREQLLHGEPHPGNVLATDAGPLFIDLETCCVGPVEFDLAHAPEAVWARYPGVDAELLLRCRLLVLAIMTSWRWDREDGHPGGRRLGVEWLAQLRADLAASGIRLAAS